MQIHQRAYGKKAGGGVLLYGPPGCGKTLPSQATAGEIKANFFPVGLHQVLDMSIGESEQKLHKIFALARKASPSVLFFGEIDALAADLRDRRGSAGRTVINQFLTEIGEEASVAGKCDGFSGADLKAIFDRATESKLEEAMKKGKVIPVTGKDPVKSAKRLKPSTRKWFESAQNMPSMPTKVDSMTMSSSTSALKNSFRA